KRVGERLPQADDAGDEHEDIERGDAAGRHFAAVESRDQCNQEDIDGEQNSPEDEQRLPGFFQKHLHNANTGTVHHRTLSFPSAEARFVRWITSCCSDPGPTSSPAISACRLSSADIDPFTVRLTNPPMLSVWITSRPAAND